MKQTLPVALVLLTLAAAAPAGRAAWGWPPPGYSVTGVRFCDGSRYRGLCAWLHDRRHGVGPGCAPVSQGPLDPSAASFRDQPGEPGILPSTPQPPAPIRVPHS
ncbi:MAG TPA: hypothetical protein VJ739_18055 [Gemmataceae bacterium]|nr:hypothetical protein [Gemmataceae bacterium]